MPDRLPFEKALEQVLLNNKDNRLTIELIRGIYFGVLELHNAEDVSKVDPAMEKEK